MYSETHDRLPANGKVFGVMARASDLTGADPKWLRIGALAILCVAFKLTLVAYCVAAIAIRMKRA